MSLDKAFVEGLMAAIIAELEAADPTNYPSKVHNSVGYVAKLARTLWVENGKGDLWTNSPPIWRDLREALSRAQRLRNPDNSSMWLQSGPTDLENIIFLAGVATGNWSSQALQATALTAVKELFADARKRGNVDFDAIRLLADMLSNETIMEPPADLIVVRPPWVNDFPMSDVPLNYEAPTLTSRVQGNYALASGHLERFTLVFGEAYNIQDFLSRGDDDVIWELLDSFDKTESPREKYSLLKALSLIGGCLVARELSARLPRTQVYLQCSILHMLDELASRPYRSELEHENEPPDVQVETTEAVLIQLQSLGNGHHAVYTRELREATIQVVQAHRMQCLRALGRLGSASDA